MTGWPWNYVQLYRSKPWRREPKLADVIKPEQEVHLGSLVLEILQGSSEQKPITHEAAVAKAREMFESPIAPGIEYLNQRFNPVELMNYALRQLRESGAVKIDGREVDGRTQVCYWLIKPSGVASSQ